MKKLSKLVALALACVMALTMLTACGGGSTVKQEELILSALNEARKEYNLEPVKLDKKLSEVAISVWEDPKDDGWPTIIIEGEEYRIAPIVKITRQSGDVDVEKWTRTFKGDIQKAIDEGDVGSFVEFSKNRLKRVGIQMKAENGKFMYYFITAFPINGGSNVNE